MRDRSCEAGSSGRWLAATMLVVALVAPGARAADGQGERWQYELTPYLWGSAMKGHTRIGTLPTIGVNMSFGDIWDALDFGLMGAFEARKGRWSLLLDGIYMKISDSATATWNGPGPIGAARTAGANVTMEQTMLAAAAAYRLSNGPTDVDVVGGLRYSKIKVETDFHASLFNATRTVAAAGSRDWIDPYVGVRVTHPVSSSLSLLGYLDAGGFGVASDITWQAVAGISYAFSKAVSAKLGYRVIYVDYDRDGFLYDMKNSGAYAGVGIRF